MNTEKPDLDPDLMNSILDRIYEGKRLAAIKEYRNARSASLKESKEFIESLTAELKEKNPERFRANRRSGCMVLFCVLAAGIWCLSH